LRRKGRLVVGADETLRAKLLQWVHSLPLGAHSGSDATLKKIKAVILLERYA